MVWSQIRTRDLLTVVIGVGGPACSWKQGDLARWNERRRNRRLERADQEAMPSRSGRLRALNAKSSSYSMLAREPQTARARLDSSLGFNERTIQ
jgi:hypothetical protein